MNVNILKSYMQVCDTHANRLQSALLKTIHLVPFTKDRLSNLNEIDAAFLEVVTSRFAKLQDTLGQKIFPLVLTHSGEDIRDKTALMQIEWVDVDYVSLNSTFQ